MARRLAFSMRAFIVIWLVALCAVGLHLRRVVLQSNAVTEIEEMRGYALYPFEVGDDYIPIFPRPSPRHPPWLVDAVGKDFLYSIVAVDLSDGSYSGDDLSSLSALPQLESLHLILSTLQGDCLAPLASAASLRHLTLDESQFSDVDFSHLRSLDRLEYLSLSTCQGIDHNCLKQLTFLRGLRFLNLSGNHLELRDLETLGRMVQLDTLMLSNSEIDSVGLRHLQSLQDIRVLVLYNTDVDDRAIETLISMPKLREVDISDTSVTEAGRNRLRMARPDIEIY